MDTQQKRHQLQLVAFFMMKLSEATVSLSQTVFDLSSPVGAFVSLKSEFIY
ncbi:hypothetical protein AO382_2247 [Moraxella catarrhalis]|uniref:Uncharacterized protein n=1 Tax=Moraxella catarrhalis TaxID=480 RepID=A0A7Z0UWR0_MORCA|nr:hypothetical protein AO382_2247 [Moraxella catarrhalis]